MAAGITVRDVFGEVRARGERAWHGLGEALPLGLTAEEGFHKIGLDWGTLLLPMQGVAPDGRVVPDPKTMLHVRGDTLAKLGTVGNGYRPIPNIDLAKFADTLVGADATVQLETAGSLYGGKRVFCSVKLPKTIEVVKEDILELYVIGSNGHDGNAACHWYPSSIRPVCANTLGFSEKDLTRGLKIQHTGQLDKKLDKARACLGIVLQEASRFEGDVKTAVRLQLTKAQAEAYFGAVYDRVFGKKAPAGELVDEQGDTVGEQAAVVMAGHKRKMIDHWLELMDAPEQSIKGIRGTGWAAYNAFSQWSDHERGTARGVVAPDVRIHSNLFGISALTKKRAWNEVLSLAK